jgi:hypothetical protein
MLSNQNCYLLSKVVVVQKPCTKKVEPVQPVVSNQPMTMEEAFAKFTVHEYITSKF